VPVLTVLNFPSTFSMNLFHIFSDEIFDLVPSIT